MADPHRGLGYALRLAGRYDQAADELRAAQRLAPKDPRVPEQLGHVYMDQQRWAPAQECFLEALRLKPDYLDARLNLAAVKYKSGDHPGAGEQLRLALEINPDFFDARYLYGTILLEQNKPQAAAQQFAQAARLNPASLDAQLKLAGALTAAGHSDQAVGALLAAVKLDPNSVEALQSLAWILATHPDASLRNGTEAVFLATRADQITQSKSPEAADALAAALAECGEFDKAVTTAERALKLANETKKPALASHIVWRVGQYRAKAAFRDTTLVAGSDPTDVIR
jgi:tetratricopeptide (TPR) repeat protein